MDKEKIKAALQAAQSALSDAMASCEGEALEEGITESEESSEGEGMEDSGMEKKAIAASIKKALLKE